MNLSTCRPICDETLIIFNDLSSTTYSNHYTSRFGSLFSPKFSIRIYRFLSNDETMKENEPLRQQRRTRSKYRHLTISNIYPLYDDDSECSTPINSSEFFHELTDLKQRLHLLEKEREVLEDKVRQYQTCCYYNEFNESNYSRRMSTTVVDNDIDRLKQRIASLVKSNDEKEKKIENLQNRFATNLNGRDEKNSLINNIDHENDEDSIPSYRTNKDSQFVQLINNENSSKTSFVCRNPLNRLKMNILQRASSVEPMMQNRQMNDMCNGVDSIVSHVSSQQRIDPKFVDRSGYVSDCADQRSSIYFKSSMKNFEKSKSTNPKGLKNFLGKIIRSPSNSSSHSIPSKLNRTNFSSNLSQWQIDEILRQLFTIDLGQYATEFEKHFPNGFDSLQLTQHDLEKKIGMKNPLHRKKFQLYFNSFENQSIEPIHLDLHWIQKWLDDIGLPQYKESFFESKVDGRLLNHLTLDDLIYLNVHYEIHYSTIKHSIQVLRMNNFDPHYIRRRPNPNDENDQMEIVNWSNHRLMDWLRSIDLAEYAANLRGSGVCGALIIFETRFNASTLAEILSIPTTKTLLRRHLTKSLRELIGFDIQNRKDQYEKSSRYSPLTTHSKIKISRRLFSSHRRTSSIDLVCPVDDQLFFVCDSPTSFV